MEEPEHTRYPHKYKTILECYVDLINLIYRTEWKELGEIERWAPKRTVEDKELPVL